VRPSTSGGALRSFEGNPTHHAIVGEERQPPRHNVTQHNGHGLHAPRPLRCARRVAPRGCPRPLPPPRSRNTLWQGSDARSARTSLPKARRYETVGATERKTTVASDGRKRTGLSICVSARGRAEHATSHLPNTQRREVGFKTSIRCAAIARYDDLVR
jgi:hypothetical protein